jgi:hypothetical protein
MMGETLSPYRILSEIGMGGAPHEKMPKFVRVPKSVGEKRQLARRSRRSAAESQDRRAARLLLHLAGVRQTTGDHWRSEDLPPRRYHSSLARSKS